MRVKQLYDGKPYKLALNRDGYYELRWTGVDGKTKQLSTHKRNLDEARVEAELAWRRSNPQMDEIEDWHNTFEGENFDGKPTGLTVVHHLDSGGLSIIIDGEEEKACYLKSSEWLILSNFLMSNGKVRDWIDQCHP
jgi:hypothetical protein